MNSSVEQRIEAIANYFDDEVEIKITAFWNEGKLHYIASAVVNKDFKEKELYWISTKKKFRNIGASQITTCGETVDEAIDNMLIECAIYHGMSYKVETYEGEDHGAGENE